jgi:hypothetical protein
MKSFHNHSFQSFIVDKPLIPYLFADINNTEI